MTAGRDGGSPRRSSSPRSRVCSSIRRPSLVGGLRAIASVALAAFLLDHRPAGDPVDPRPRVDAFGFSFLRRTKTKQEVEDGFWGKLAGWVMKHPLMMRYPVLLLLALIIPFGNIRSAASASGTRPWTIRTRMAQEAFDKGLPLERTEGIKLIVVYDENNADDPGPPRRARRDGQQARRERAGGSALLHRSFSPADEGALSGSRVTPGHGLVSNVGVRSAGPEGQEGDSQRDRTCGPWTTMGCATSTWRAPRR